MAEVTKYPFDIYVGELNIITHFDSAPEVELPLPQKILLSAGVLGMFVANSTIGPYVNVAKTAGGEFEITFSLKNATFVYRVDLTPLPSGEHPAELVRADVHD